MAVPEIEKTLESLQFQGFSLVDDTRLECFLVYQYLSGLFIPTKARIKVLKNNFLWIKIWITLLVADS